MTAECLSPRAENQVGGNVCEQCARSKAADEVVILWKELKRAACWYVLLRSVLSVLTIVCHYLVAYSKQAWETVTTRHPWALYNWL
jgi:hypothetical protein